MNKYIISLALLTLFNTFFADAQQILKGNIVDESNNEPLAFATIYLNTTSIGTTSDASGNFQFKIQEGEHEVIVQFIGYQSLSFKIDSRNLASNYRVKLVKETQELATVMISGERDKIWYQNLKLFKKYFIGTSQNALKCEILNEKSLIIDDDPTTATMKVYAKEPLQIYNPNLGYTLQYSLIEFTYEFRKGKVFFAGYPYFKLNDLPKRKVKRIEKNRKRSYEGSLPHLIKSLLNNKVQEEGFRVMKLYRVPNPERPPDSIITAARNEFLHGNLSQKEKDSLRTNILTKSSLAKTIDMLDTAALNAKDLIQERENGIYLVTETLLQIVFQNEKEEPNYVIRSNAKKAGPQTSIIHILSGAEQLNPLGDISNPANILMEGYLAWEKIGDLLPLDYTPN